MMTPRACERDAAKLERELEYIGKMRLANPSFTLWGGRYNTEPIGSAGIIIFQPGVGEAWLRGSTRMEQHPVTSARYVQKRFGAIAREHKLRRVQMLVETEDESGPAPYFPWLETRPTLTPQLKFAKWLGFQVEGLMRRLGPNGENFYMMGWVDPAAVSILDLTPEDRALMRKMALMPFCSEKRRP
jgi:hypothetical protein